MKEEEARNIKEEARNIIHSGFKKMTPYLKVMTDAMTESYIQGFKDCWKLLTDKDLEL